MHVLGNVSVLAPMTHPEGKEQHQLSHLGSSPEVSPYLAALAFVALEAVSLTLPEAVQEAEIPEMPDP